MIIPVNGTAILIIATTFLNISSLKRCGKFSKVTPSACLILGTEIVWNPTPKFFSRCSLCIINDKTSNLGSANPNKTPPPTSSIPPSIALSKAFK